jgi:hypothetical protein
VREAVGSRIHVAQDRRVGHRAAQRGRQEVGRFVRSQAACREQAAYDLWEVQPLSDGEAGAVVCGAIDPQA